jgi:hypothetical protein
MGAILEEPHIDAGNIGHDRCEFSFEDGRDEILLEQAFHAGLRPDRDAYFHGTGRIDRSQENVGPISLVSRTELLQHSFERLAHDVLPSIRSVVCADSAGCRSRNGIGRAPLGTKRFWS